MAEFDLYVKSYKLTAPNLFDYLQLEEFIEDNSFYIYSSFPDKQTLTIDVIIFNHCVTEFITLLPVGIVIERD